MGKLIMVPVKYKVSAVIASGKTTGSKNVLFSKTRLIREKLCRHALN